MIILNNIILNTIINNIIYIFYMHFIIILILLMKLSQNFKNCEVGTHCLQNCLLIWDSYNFVIHPQICLIPFLLLQTT